jgi:dihydrofolate reductase
MGQVIISISMSLDGFVAGPNDHAGQGLGEGGDVLHDWIQDEDPAQMFGETGAIVVGRRMFDVSGAWDGNPPGGLPCFVVTHHAPAEWDGPGSAFTFVPDGVQAAVELARAAAGDKNVGIGGGANVCRQALEAGVVDELELQLVPVILGGGQSLFEGQTGTPLELEPVRARQARHATHLRYRIGSR